MRIRMDLRLRGDDGKQRAMPLVVRNQLLPGTSQRRSMRRHAASVVRREMGNGSVLLQAHTGRRDLKYRGTQAIDTIAVRQAK